MLSTSPRAGCPTNIRVQTDDRPGVEWGFLYSLLDPEDVDMLTSGTGVRSALLVDGEPTGVSLTILSGDPVDGVSANVDLHDDENLLLAAVDTDAAILDAARVPDRRSLRSDRARHPSHLLGCRGLPERAQHRRAQQDARPNGRRARADHRSTQ